MDNGRGMFVVGRVGRVLPVAHVNHLWKEIASDVQ